MSWCFQLPSVATALSFLVSLSACPRIEWGSSKERDASGSHLMWPKQKLWKKTTIPNSGRKYPATQVKKNPGWKAPEISHISLSAFFLFTDNSLTSEWFMRSLYENCYKRFLKVIVWKKVNMFGKQALFQEKRQYQRGCQNASGKKRGWCCSQDVFHWFEVKRKWRKTCILHTLCSHKKPDLHYEFEILC